MPRVIRTKGGKILAKTGLNKPKTGTGARVQA